MTKNFGAAAQDYAKHRAGFPDSFYDRLQAFGIGIPGQVVVDIGTGTGTLARGFALLGCRAVGIDPDERLMEQAKALDREAQVAVEYRNGVAEDIPLEDDSADVITAGTCWHWFDGTAAMREIKRIARHDAFVVVANFAWLPLPGNLVEATERLIEKHNPDWDHGGGNGGMDLGIIEDFQNAGISNIESFSYDMDVPYTHESWRGRIRASAGIGAALSPEEIQAFDTEHARLLEQSFNTGILNAHHRIYAVIGNV